MPWWRKRGVEKEWLDGWFDGVAKYARMGESSCCRDNALLTDHLKP